MLKAITFTINDFFLIGIEILVLSFLIYQVLILIKGTRAVSIAIGICLLLAIYFVTEKIGLYTINWLLGKIVPLVFISLPIVFQPEIRKGLEKIGKSSFWRREFSSLGQEERYNLISILASCSFKLVREKIGALIVIERSMNLDSFVEGGILLDGKVSEPLVLSIFYPHNPLHDGAIIIRGDRIRKARCFLPLTDNPEISEQLGSRHRAALGLTEISDAIVIVVSEERGEVSLSNLGKIIKIPDEKILIDTILKISFPLKYKKK